MRALSIDVYRDSDRWCDCTNGGISSKFTRLLVLCDDGNITIPDDKELPENLVRVVKRTFAGQDVYHVEPVAEPNGAGWMMGGNYAASSDSRFSRMIGGMYGAVAIHDRQESWDFYNMMN